MTESYLYRKVWRQILDFQNRFKFGYLCYHRSHFHLLSKVWDMETSVIFERPQDIRAACRDGSFAGQTSGHAPGYAQANLCILPKEYAFDFLLFCQRNPKPCPLLHVLEPGVYRLGDIDIRKDVPRYRVYRDGVFVEEPTSISDDLWQEDMVTFVIGCSFSFEDALMRAGLKIRHVEQKRNVPM